MKKFRKYFYIALLTLLFVGTFAYLYRRSRPEKILYEEVTPSMGSIERTAVVTGTIVPRNEVNVKPQISGIISELNKEAGQTVKEGEVIAKVKVIPEMSSLSAAQSRVRLAEVNLRQAQTNYDREKALYDKQLVSAESFDQVAQALAQAKEEHSAAKESLEVVRDGVSSRNASSSSTLVRSTITGLILDIPVKVGNSVILSNTFNDGTTIATVADMNDLIFDGNVDETEVGRLREGMPVTIKIGALQDLTLDAVLEYISPKATQNNGANQFQIKAAVQVPGDTMIRSGYSANATIVLEKVENVLMVPESTVTFEGDTTSVLVLLGKEYEKKNIRTGLSDGVNIEVKDGLTTSDKVRGNRIYETK